MGGESRRAYLGWNGFQNQEVQQTGFAGQETPVRTRTGVQNQGRHEWWFWSSHSGDVNVWLLLDLERFYGKAGIWVGKDSEKGWEFEGRWLPFQTNTSINVSPYLFSLTFFKQPRKMTSWHGSTCLWWVLSFWEEQSTTKSWSQGHTGEDNVSVGVNLCSITATI